MGVTSFRSLFMVASCASAALGCYLVSLRVASERASLENVETEIVLAQRDLRTLQTEIGTRGRLAQLERWNVKVLALSAPSADQFLKGSFELAKLAQPEHRSTVGAPVVLAAAPAKPAQPPIGKDDDDGDLAGVQPSQPTVQAPSARPDEMLHSASLRTELPLPTTRVERTAGAAEIVKKSPRKPTALAAAEVPGPHAAKAAAPSKAATKTATAKDHIAKP